MKLVAALGAWLGPGLAVWLGLYAAIAGGPMALGMALSRGYAKQAFSNIWGLLGYWRLAGVTSSSEPDAGDRGGGSAAAALCTSDRGGIGADAMAAMKYAAATAAGGSDRGSELIELAIALPILYSSSPASWISGSSSSATRS